MSAAGATNDRAVAAHEAGEEHGRHQHPGPRHLVPPLPLSRGQPGPSLQGRRRVSESMENLDFILKVQFNGQHFQIEEIIDFWRSFREYLCKIFINLKSKENIWL